MVNKKAVLLFILLMLWTGVIFYFSSQPSNVSNHQSKTAVRIISGINDIFDITDTKLYGKLERAAKEILPSRYKSPNVVVRKSAHFGIYFILGIIACGFGYLYSRKIFMGALLGISLPILIAVLDEYNQGFSGRTSSLQDLIIDGAGALTGTAVIIMLLLTAKAFKALKRIF